MSTSITVICVGILLSLGLASGVNNAIGRDELNNMGFSFHNLASNSVGGTIGFWSMGDPQFSDIIYLDYGASDQFNHWVVFLWSPPSLVMGTQPGIVDLNNYLLNVANSNMFDIQAYPEFHSQNYYFTGIGDTGGSWRNSGSMVYESFGHGGSSNFWMQMAPSPDPLEQKLMTYKSK